MTPKPLRQHEPTLAADALHAPVGSTFPSPELASQVALRVRQIVKPSGILPISASTWWAGVKSGRYPQPIKLSPRVTVWRLDQVLEILNINQA